ncbi:MAG: lytic transglycosylase domain-containing protein [Rubellimicrobium sp.]|nr:lytic transglycosylase domain-containing protein [Rubellimicrobium sp.]
MVTQNSQTGDAVRPVLVLLALLALAACSRPAPVSHDPAPAAGTLNPGETPQMRALINETAAFLEIPPQLLHRVIQRESDYNAAARNGPYYGLMQILPETARGMGYDGPIEGLLDAETNLRYGGAYLRGAWIVGNRNPDEAMRWYASGYYYEARDRCLLVATGLRARETAPACRER